MICEIITIGTEIVIGSTVNTNSLFLSQKLTELGINVHYHTSVDDNKERLESIIKTAINRSHIIITTGGLGPTKDDVTKEVFSRVLKEIIDLNRNIKYIENTIGTAPGILIENNNKKIIMLPGPPIEMELMFENSIKDLLKNNLNIVTRSINLVGICESSLEKRLNTLNLNTKNTKILTFAKTGVVEIKILSKALDKDTINSDIENISKRIEDEFSSFIYGYNNIKLEEAVVKLLIEKNLILGVCESITGGMISSKITSVPGASNIFKIGLITYSNEAKIQELNVKKDTLINYGAVSKKTALEMAEGLFYKSNIDIGLSITGLAGPGGARPGKAVGLVYICIITNEFKKVFEYNFKGNRNLIRKRATIEALNKLRILIKNN